MSPDVVWVAILALGAAIEAHAILNKTRGDTLSERIRDWFSTRTPGGKAGWLVVWTGFAIWMAGHIAFGW